MLPDGTTEQPFGWCGRFGMMDDHNGLHYARKRYLRAASRQFLSLDPIPGTLANLQTFNRYSYAGNNPIALHDASGLFWKEIGEGIWDATGGSIIRQVQQPIYFAQSAYHFHSYQYYRGSNPEKARYHLDAAGRANDKGMANAQAVMIDATVGLATAGVGKFGPGIWKKAGKGFFKGSGGNTTSGFVNLANPQKTSHILIGDSTGGGHLFPGATGKSPFPQSWSGERIMHEISDVATDPLSSFMPGRGGRTIVRGTRDGIDLSVILGGPREGGGIISGFPTNIPRNP